MWVPSSGNAIDSQSTVNATINNGNISSNTGYVINNNGTGNILINNATVERTDKNGTSIRNYNTGKITIKTGMYNLGSSDSISINSGEVIIEGGTFNITGNAYRDFVRNSAKFSITGGTFNINTQSTNLLYNVGEANVTGGTFNMATSKLGENNRKIYYKECNNKYKRV